ncbi:hypothetical protein [Synechococcus sp. CS-1328]|uniref:hypothetical protein n=1 Tax=Synechococcus sp. CS-1328 TaxID=2847976 RepID=UPI00223BC5EA|nr:hypothetical protein [Synechococcus sp. CS-1328]MCT0224192.1 hypothetical protein [Synechococcus sp. CS-1328]
MSRAHHRPPPRWWDSLWIGLTSVVIGAVLAAIILAMAEQARRNGNLEQARDSTVMLFSPAIFLLAGGGLISRGLLGLAGALLRRWSRRGGATPHQFSHATGADPSPRHRPQTPPTPAPLPAAAKAGPEAAPPSDLRGHDRYLRACAELGVPPGSDWPVIRASWRRKLQHWHPDQGGDPELWYRRLAAYTLLEAWERFDHDSKDADRPDADREQ